MTLVGTFLATSRQQSQQYIRQVQLQREQLGEQRRTEREREQLALKVERLSGKIERLRVAYESAIRANLEYTWSVSESTSNKPEPMAELSIRTARDKLHAALVAAIATAELEQDARDVGFDMVDVRGAVVRGTPAQIAEAMIQFAARARDHISALETKVLDLRSEQHRAS